MFNRKKPDPHVTPSDITRVVHAIDRLTKATTQERLEVAALRRVLEAATDYEHPAAATQRRLAEMKAKIAATRGGA